MICDILSDPDGWAWDSSDRSRYNSIRKSLMENDAQLLRDRTLAAARALCRFGDELGVHSHRLAAMGWCLGAQPILELGMSPSDSFTIRTMITFHGVFHRDTLRASPDQRSDQTKEQDVSGTGGELLVCNGADDPFVSTQDLEDVKETLGHYGWHVHVLNYDGAKHGFSNPAQEWNPNPAFGYNRNAADQSWQAAMRLLEKTVS